MGYDTYNAFNSNFTGALATEQARLMYEYGLVEAGYNVIASTLSMIEFLINVIADLHP
jgi:hypothetical protein